MSIEIIEEQTYREQDNEATKVAKTAIRHLITTFKQLYTNFWNRDPEKIIETMNDNVELYLARFAENTAIGNFHNQRAETLGIVDRIPVVMPQGYSFNTETNLFEYSEPIVEDT